MDTANYIRRCLQDYSRALETHLGWGGIQTWRYTSFKHLAKEISEATGIPVSHTTLIRVLQKEDYKRAPQVATLDALAQYLGYEGWEQFCLAETTEEPAPSPRPAQEASPGTAGIKDSPSSSLTKSPLWPWSLLGTAVAAMVIWAVGTWLFPAPVPPVVKFECVNPVGVFPHHFSFAYKVPEVGYQIFLRPRSFAPHHKDLSIGKGHFLEISAEDSFISYSSNMLPDAYFAHLVYKGESIKKVPLMLKTPGWIVLGSVLTEKVLKGTPSKVGRVRAKIGWNAKGQLGILDSLVHALAREAGENPFRIKMIYCDSFQVEANNFSFKTKVRLKPQEAGLNCDFITCCIQTTQGIIEIPLVKPGCKSHVNIWFSEYTASAKRERIEEFEADLTEWQTVQITVKEGIGEIYRNGTLLKAISYKQPLGEITAVRFVFSQAGEVDYVELRDDQGKPVQLAGFNPPS